MKPSVLCPALLIAINLKTNTKTDKPVLQVNTKSLLLKTSHLIGKTSVNLLYSRSTVLFFA
jgi:hypothetical protein